MADDIFQSIALSDLPMLRDLVPKQRNPLAAGLSAGVDDLQARGGAALAAVGKALEIPQLEQLGRDINERNQREAIESGRPDLETAPWREGGGEVLPWLGYQAAKQAPQIAAQIAAMFALPQMAVPASLSRLGAAVPAALGGGRGMAGAAATRAGQEWAQGVSKVTLAGLPTAVGSQYQEALEREQAGSDPASKTDALLSFVGAVPYAALDAMQPVALAQLARRGLEKGLLQRVATTAAAGGLSEIPQEGAQTAIEMGYRWDLPLRDKLNQVVDAALTGGAVGGVFGAFGGVRGSTVAKATAPDTPNDQLAERVDAMLALPPAEKRLALPPPPIYMGSDPSYTAPPPPLQIEASRPTVVEPDGQVRSALVEANTPVGRAPEPQQDPLETQDTAFLQRAAFALERKREAGSFTQDDAQLLTRIERTLEQRKAQGEMPLGRDIQVSPRASEQTQTMARDLARFESGETPEVQATRAELLQDLGKASSPTLNRLNFESKPAAVAYIEDAIRAGKSLPRDLDALAKKYNLLDQDGRPVDLDKAITKATADAERYRSLVTSSAQNREVNFRKMREAEQRVAELQQSQQTLAQAAIYRGEQSSLIAPNARTAQDIENIRIAQALGMPQERAANPSFQPPIEPPSAQTNPMADAIDPATASERNRQMSQLMRVSRMPNLSPRLQNDVNTVRAMISGRRAGADAAYDSLMADVHAETGNTLFSAITPADVQTPALDNAAFDRTFRAFTGKLAPQSRDNIRIVNSVADLPDGVELAAARKGFDAGSIRGVMHNGEVYVVRSNIRGAADLQEVLAHEVFGHVGAQNLFGASRKDAMLELYNAAGGIAGVRSLAKKFKVEKELNAYIPEGTLTDQQKVEVFDELLAQAAGRATGNLSTMLREWVGRVKQGFIAALRNMGFTDFADRLNTVSANDVARILADMRNAARTGSTFGQDTAFSIDTSVQGMQNATKKMIDLAQVALEKALPKLGDRNAAVRKGILWLTTLHHNVQMNKDAMPALEKYEATTTKRDAITQLMSQMFSTTYTPYYELEKSQPNAARLVRDLMAYTQFRIDPTRPWLQQTHLHNEKNSATLERLVKEARQKYFDLTRAGKADVYLGMAHANSAISAASTALMMHNLVAQSPAYTAGLPMVARNPMDEFLSRTEIHSSTQKIDQFWQAKLNDYTEGFDTYLKQKEVEIAKLPPSKASAENDRLTPIAKMYVSALRVQSTLATAPYFHLGRTGDYFAAFDVRTLPGDETTADPAALEAIARRMTAAGFTDIEINKDNPLPRVYMRLQTEQQLEGVQRIVKEMQAEKNSPVNPDPTTARFGLRAKSREELGFMDKDQLNTLISAITSRWNEDVLQGLTGDKREMARDLIDTMQSQFVQTYLDLMPDASVAKVTTERDAVPGFTHDMVQSYAHRLNVGIRALAGLAIADDRRVAFKEMRDTINSAQTSRPAAETLRMQEVFNEVVTRDVQRSMGAAHPFLDRWSGINHSYFLGMSPSYALINMLQPGVLLWPELAKSHGFVASAKAIARATTPAIQIMKAAAEYAYAHRGLSGIADASITPDAFKGLIKNGTISQADADYIMKLVYRGDIDIGSFSRELINVSRGSRAEKGLARGVDETLRWGSMVGYYTETVSRLMSALAARDLNGRTGDQKELEYGSRTIKESMFIYSDTNTARALGRMGFAGKFTKLMFAFMSYQAQLIEKLYREMHGLMSKGSTPEQRVASARFLGAHAGAMLTLAGTLGLPGATAIAAAVDKLAGLFGDDDEPYDVKVAWRKFLSDMFGKEVGQLLSRGLVRQLNIDLAQRAGEGDIVPFSRLLSDRRKLEDSLPDWSMQMLGSPVSMGVGIVMGLRDISQGNVLEGMIKALPMAFRSPVQAYSLTAKGYVDKGGNQLPLEAGAFDVLAQALGFKTADKAEYDERNLAMLGRKGEIMRRASNIRKNLAEAIEQGDVEDQRKWLAEARRFDKNQPAYAIMPTLASVLQRRAMARETASALDTPVRMNVRDAEGRRRIDF